MLHVTVPQIPGARVRSRRSGATWQVTAPRVHVVQQLAACSVGVARISDLELDVDNWGPPVEGWLGRPGLPGITAMSFERRGSGARLRLSTLTPVDAGVLIAAAVRVLRPVPTGDVGPLMTFCPGLPVEAAPLASRIVDVLTPEETRDAHVRRCDTLVAPGTGAAPEAERARTIIVSTSAWTRDGQPFDVDVDPTVHRPLGRRSAAGTIARAAVAGDQVTLSGPGLTLAIAGEVEPADARALRGTGAIVTDDPMPVRIARQLTACGVVVGDAATMLPEPDDALGWQALSVHERRHALRQFGPSAALDAWPSVSVVLVTNRPDHVEHALRQVSGLRYPRLEVVVGAHGGVIDAARVREQAREVPHPVTVVELDSSLTLGEALQACSDRAGGALITKMDDDDVYGPEHIWDLVLAREYSGAQVVGKALDWIYVESEDTTVFRPTYAAERYADFVAGGTMLISRADLLSVGGWRPVPKSVDRALLDRVLADGGLVYRTHGLGYVYVRHSAGHTASVSDAHFLTKVAQQYPGLIRHEAFGTQDGLPGWMQP